GMAAIHSSLMSLVKSGSRIVAHKELYGSTWDLLVNFLPTLGVETVLADLNDEADRSRALKTPRGEIAVVYCESISNPTMNVADVPAIARAAHAAGGKLLVDATFATPLLQRPLSLGADLVLHSATKYLGGHNDLLAGSLSGSGALVSAIRDFRGVLGTILDPHSAYLLLRGMKTLALRVEKQNATALEVARYLESHPRVLRVFYPGLASHPDHEVARAQMSGFGGVVSFVVDGSLEDVSRFVDATEVPLLAPSLGGVESLIEQPALMSFYELTKEERAAIGIAEGLVRLSVGIEDAEDLIADLGQALESLSPLERHGEDRDSGARARLGVHEP
ncbi:MAG TPA: aminotransferase class I/II-fold pyridoxal phosphate-dependent enzyme, partial [Thermoanaerobaculia bacterium]|nr:aminotransferase class I/II-fold pyridoxal phosphate-dependent enzyme [Thermoanaerobaculia bacterium]